MSRFKFGQRKCRPSTLSCQSAGRRSQRAATDVIRAAAIESLEERRLLSGGSYVIGTGAPTSDLVSAVTRDAATGKVIVAGVQSTTNTVELARFNADGTLDTTFGTGGGVVAGSLGAARLNAITVDNTGHIVAAGTDSTSAVVVRFNSDGSLDSTFGVGGVTHVGDFTDIPAAVAISPANEIAIAGTSGFGFSGRQFFVSELSTVGSELFTTLTPIGSDAAANAVVFADGGSSIVAGGQSTSEGVTTFTLAKYDSLGALNVAFDGDGIAQTVVGENSSIVKSLALTDLGANVVAIGAADGVAIVQYDTTTGTASTLVSSGGAASVLGGGVDASGNIYVAGVVNDGSQLGSARYNSSGVLDLTYGSAGIATSPLQIGDFNTAQVYVSTDGTVVHATSTDPFGADSDLAVGTTDSTGAAGFASTVGFTEAAPPELVTATLDGGVLTITGTSTADNIEVHLNADGNYRVNANAQAKMIFTGGLVTSIVINAGGGGDYVVVGAAITAPAEVHGEEGNDTITSGAGDDAIFGDNGDDVLLGRAGQDVFHGGFGNDTITGGANDDLLFGDEGNDSLIGSGGADVFVGGDDNDTLTGGGGRDVLIGGDGMDSITGDNGQDIVIGGTTSHDTDPVALNDIRNVWNGDGTYNARVNSLKNSLLVLGTDVMDDGLTDILIGGDGKDWLLSDSADIVIE
jgi:uncharacterized delta-60 repeat protein